jgi:hypothetical protein
MKSLFAIFHYADHAGKRIHRRPVRNNYMQSNVSQLPTSQFLEATRERTNNPIILCGSVRVLLECAHARVTLSRVMQHEINIVGIAINAIVPSSPIQSAMLGESNLAFLVRALHVPNIKIST